LACKRKQGTKKDFQAFVLNSWAYWERNGFGVLGSRGEWEIKFEIVFNIPSGDVEYSVGIGIWSLEKQREF
jgi:hypothetical protein